MQQRIAVIGSGIAGLTSAYLLSKHHEVTLFEANDYLGGHTNTVPIETNGNIHNIDTGFIVFNRKTYPNFCHFLEKHNIPVQISEMSFSYRSDANNLEYNGNNLNTLFCDRRNLYKPRFYRFINQIIKFNRDAKIYLNHLKNSHTSIREFIASHQYSNEFVDYYLIPMMAAIWSKNKSDTLECNAGFILGFYANHGLLNLTNRPPWYVLKNGSNSYISSFLKNIKGEIHLNTKIVLIDRQDDKVVIKSDKDEYVFDKVFIATHSNQALDMLSKPTETEQNILSKIKYTENEVTLHTDSNVMPKRKLAWASWNYYDNGNDIPTLTYYMNRLQSIKSTQSFFVSVNLGNQIADSKIIKRIRYAHPCLNMEASIAQRKIDLINGLNNTYYVGSYWGNGFHEDGVNSAINTCKLLGIDYV